MSKSGLQTREERMTNLMKDIEKYNQLFWKKERERFLWHTTQQINSRCIEESQLAKPEEDIVDYLISEWGNFLKT